MGYCFLKHLTVLQCILTKPVRIPRALSVKAGSVLKYLLRRDPDERLGCNKEQGFNQIKQHPFFNVLDWDLLEQRQVCRVDCRPKYISPYNKGAYIFCGGSGLIK